MARPLNGRRGRSDMLARVSLKDRATPGWRDKKYENGAWMYSDDGTMLDDKGNRSIFDDIDE